MQFIGVAFLVASVCVVACANQNSYIAHVKTLKKFHCGHPQPRVFELEDVIDKDVLKDKYEGVRDSIRPPVTVLHRCFSAGYCKNCIRKGRCMPRETKEVTLSFAVLHPKSVEYFEVKATNHTQCHCVKEDGTNIK